jgi:hypothetical protein
MRLCVRRLGCMGLDLVALTGAELSRINACVATLLRSVCCCGQDLKGVLCADQWPSSTSRWIDDNNRDVDLLQVMVLRMVLIWHMAMHRAAVLCGMS